MERDATSRPAARLSPLDAIAIIVGVVVGVGIFSAPAMVAAGADTPGSFLGLWVLGGALSIAGALCYGELVATFPSTGGEYSFLRRAFGQNVSFLFAWARLTVIGTGSIALLAFVFGDHLMAIAPLGAHGSAIYAASIVVALVGINVLGLRLGAALQKVLTATLVLGLLVLVGAALVMSPAERVEVPPESATASSSVGLAMVFVLLTYGGWNEAAYLSAEIRGSARRIALTIVAGVGVIALLYVLVNTAYLRVLGLPGIRASTTPGADTAAGIGGAAGAYALSILVAAAALTSINATLLTVSRSAYAFGRDVPLFRFLGHWNERAGAPRAALLCIGVFVLALILLGTIVRRGFATMVEYTAPVFWTFFLLTGLSVFVLRKRSPHAARPFRVPFYPLTPIVFCATCAWLLHASLAYTGVGAIVGVLVLAAGAFPLALANRTRRPRVHEVSKGVT